MLFTIGTSDRSQTEFFTELADRDVWLLIDVRSSPYSRQPWACRPTLERSAPTWGMEYSFSGQLLGGRNTISTFERDFKVCSDAILEASAQGPVAIFCAEGDPAFCHRSYKVGAYWLYEHGVMAENILRRGQVESVQSTLLRTPRRLIPPCIEARRSLL